MQGGRARARPRRRAASGTGRGRSTSTCCCSGRRPTRPSGSTIPHRELARRRFVLVPLLELDPELALPDGTPLAAALAALEGQEVRRAGPAARGARRESRSSRFRRVRGRVWPVVVVAGPRARRQGATRRPTAWGAGGRLHGRGHGRGRVRRRARGHRPRHDPARPHQRGGPVRRRDGPAGAGRRPRRRRHAPAHRARRARRCGCSTPAAARAGCGSTAAPPPRRSRSTTAPPSSGSVVDGRVRVRGGSAELSGRARRRAVAGARGRLRDRRARGCRSST